MQLFNLGDRDKDTDCISTSLDVWQFLMSDTFNHVLNEHFWIALLKDRAAAILVVCGIDTQCIVFYLDVTFLFTISR